MVRLQMKSLWFCGTFQKIWKSALSPGIYCNKDMIEPLTKAFKNLIATGFVKELKTWDGCFNIRGKRGNADSMSLHSWGVAIDVNAAWNGFGKKPTLSKEFVKCFTDAGFDLEDELLKFPKAKNDDVSDALATVLEIASAPLKTQLQNNRDEARKKRFKKLNAPRSSMMGY